MTDFGGWMNGVIVQYFLRIPFFFSFFFLFFSSIIIGVSGRGVFFIGNKT